MKPFRFPLQRVLDVKIVLEEQQQLMLADAEKHLAAAQSALHEATSAHAAAVASGNASGVDADPLLRTVSWRGRGRLLNSVYRQSAATEAMRHARDEARAVLVQRHQERRSLELLEQKQRDQHRREQWRRQQALVDDLTGATYIRLKREDGDE